MPNAKVLEQKKAQVASLVEKIKNSPAGVLVDYKGINVADDTALRKELRENGVEYSVVKNTMLKFAAQEVGFDGMIEHLNGTTAIAIASEDVVAPAKILAKFAKDHDKLELKAGIVEGKVADAKELAKYASIPSRETLLTMIAAGLKSPLRDVAICLDLYAKQKQEN